MNPSMGWRWPPQGTPAKAIPRLIGLATPTPIGSSDADSAQHVVFTDRERAHLRFMRWLCQTGRLVP
jgi:hypothetical protein